MPVRSRRLAVVLALAILATQSGAGCKTGEGEPRIRNLPRVPFSSTDVQVQTVYTRGLPAVVAWPVLRAAPAQRVSGLNAMRWGRSASTPRRFLRSFS